MGILYEAGRREVRAVLIIQRARAQYVEGNCERCCGCNWLYPIERLENCFATCHSGACKCPVCCEQNSML